MGKNMTKFMEEHVIWDSEPDFKDWEEDLRTENPEMDENELIQLMYEINGSYLDDEKLNCSSIVVPNGIFMCADLGLWYGRRYGIFDGPDFTEVRECFRGFCHGQSELRVYVDCHGELRTQESHHDGTNLYWFRAWRPGVTETQKENLYALVYDQQSFEKRLRRLTFRLGDLIGDVYGWAFPYRPKCSIPCGANR